MNTCSEGSKRQLPPWMVQKKIDASHVSNSDNVVETNCDVEKGDIAANDGDATKKIAGVDRKRKNSKRESNLDAKCEVKMSRNGDNIIQPKKKRANRCRDGVHKSSRKKGQNLEDPSHGSCDVIPVQLSSDDDMDLTIEDLMAIAEQYVKDHENKVRQKTPGRRCEPDLLIPATSASGTAFDSPCENNKSSSSAREALDNSTLTTTGQLVTTIASQTDNPAQDMLDLLLGPLLRNIP
ncbi:hypothetical protein Lalb_Chr03g0024971 [Lupinus albus]|uniref:Uncharacterized protein n=1 Tax=Lupinus albus TaxID=3870 RepID=A0A6A4QSA1_LUPAL|nr:hypothetical protein Lalb_Chr03g0024971 [Lupinus albus]